MTKSYPSTEKFLQKIGGGVSEYAVKFEKINEIFTFDSVFIFIFLEINERKRITSTS